MLTGFQLTVQTISQRRLFARLLMSAIVGAVALWSAPGARGQSGSENPVYIPPASSGGEIDVPEPTSGDSPSGEPGCFVSFRRGPGLLGPPCAFRCATKPDVDYQSACSSQPENSIGCADTDWNEVPCDSPDADCHIHKGLAGETTSTHFFPNGHPRCLGVKGDPHLKTFDGKRYDLQAGGEFVFARSLDDSFEVQARLEPYGSNRNVSVTTAVAVNVAPYRVTVTLKSDTRLRVDGEPFDLPDGGVLMLPDADAMILRRARRYSIVLPDDTNVHIDCFGRSTMNFFVLLPETRDGRISGIGGDGDGEKTNDFFLRDGTRMDDPPPFEALYDAFAESWRVSEETSLFDYGPDDSFAGFQDPDMPNEKVSVNDIPLGDRTRAESACRAAGLLSGPALEDCIFDYALTRDPLFIEAALSTQTPREFAAVQEGFAVDAPVRAFAAHRVELSILGPVERGKWLGFAPETGDDLAEATNSYSARVLNGNEETVSLIAPIRPGKYELRYREARAPGAVSYRAPFEVVRPEIEIQAAGSAPAGGELSVELTGDVGDYMTVTLVPAGSESRARGRSFALEQGGGAVGTLARLPEEAGDYEIRVVSNFRPETEIYARQSVRLE